MHDRFMKKTITTFFKSVADFFKPKSNSKPVSSPKANSGAKAQEPVKAPATPSPIPKEKLLGIDVSHHNGKLNWQAIKKAGVVYAYIKCTEGTGFSDPRFLENVNGARAVGIKVGAYHFFRPGKDAIAQAIFFLGKIKNLNLDLIPVCDWEVHDGMGESSQVAQVKLFVEYITKIMGVLPMIYTGKWFVDEVDAKDRTVALPQWLAKYPLWLSDYSPASVALPKPWTGYTLLQTTEEGKLSGVAGEFDLNLLDGPISKLQG